MPPSDLTNDDRGALQKLSSGVKVVLLLSAAALAGVVWIFWIRGQSTYTFVGEDPQRHVALAASLVLLSALLVWLTRLDGSLPLRGLLAGLLSGLSGMICLLVAVEALDSWLTGAVSEALAMNVLTYAPLVGMFGGVVGLVCGCVAASAQQQPRAL